MKTRACPWGLLLAFMLAFATVETQAQTRDNGQPPQQNQQGRFAQGIQNSLGATGQGRQGSTFSAQQSSASLGQQQNQGQQPGVRQNGFVGSSAEQVRNQLRNQNPRQPRQAVFNFAIESLNELRESRRQRQSQRNAAPPVRVHLRPLFVVAQPTSTELTARVHSQLDNALPEGLAAPQVSVHQGTVTLQGQAQSDYDRLLMEKMVALQPGVSQVENRLTIDPGQGEPALVVPLR